MKKYLIPNIKEILKPRWAHKPGFGMKEAFILHKRESYQQHTAPEDPNLLQKLGIKKGEKVLAIAGYYASWASEIAKKGVKVDYSDISKDLVVWARKKYGKLFKKYICSNYELIPKRENEYDWTFTFEACGGGSGLPIAYLRALLNKKGGILIYALRYGKHKRKMGSKPKRYPKIAKYISKAYGATYKIKKIRIRSHRIDNPTRMIPHMVFTIKTNKKARELAKQDLKALFSNKFKKENLGRLTILSKSIDEDFLIKGVEMKKDEKTHNIWKEYVDKPMYRVVPSQDYKQILKKGIDPKRDRYKKIKPKLKRLLKIILEMEKGGVIMIFKWGYREVSGSYALKVTLNDLSLSTIDFTPNKSDIGYYSKLYGGAVVSNTKRITKKLIEEKPRLSKQEWKLIKELHGWAKKRTCKNKVFYVQGSSKIFENAFFQILSKNKRKRGYKKPIHLPSPFGSFKHFKKTIKKKGLNKYLNYIKKGQFYLRVQGKIPANEIKELK